MKKSTMKMLALLLLAAMMLAAFTACGSNEAPSTSPVPPAETTGKPAAGSAETEPVTINFWHHYSAQSAENETLMNVLIPRFEEENPGIKVNAVSHEWADLHDKILISAQSNTLPDVARLDIAWVPEFQKMGILTALDEEMADFDSVTADLLESAMSTGFVSGHYYAMALNTNTKILFEEMADFDSVTADLLESAMSTGFVAGHYYAMALNTNTKILFYNEKVLEEAGVAVPTTMDEFVKAVAAVSGKNSAGQTVWGLNEPALAGWNVLPYIWSNGGEITNEDNTKASGYINSEKTIAAVQMLADMAKNGELSGYNSGDIPMTDGFGTGRYIFLLEGPWKTAELAGAYPDMAYGNCQLPAGEAGSISVLGGEDIAMFNGEHKDAAWKFMQFMTSPFAEEEMAKCGQIPVNKTALESETVKNASFAPFLEAITTAKARPAVATWSEIDNELTVAMTKILTEGADVKETLDALAVTIDGLLA